jgi:hypothetical protein
MLMLRNQNSYTLRGANESAVRLESFAEFPQRQRQGCYVLFGAKKSYSTVR